MQFTEIGCKWQQFNLSSSTNFWRHDAFMKFTFVPQIYNLWKAKMYYVPQPVAASLSYDLAWLGHKICRQIKAKAKQLSCFSLWHWPFLCCCLTVLPHGGADSPNTFENRARNFFDLVAGSSCLGFNSRRIIDKRLSLLPIQSLTHFSPYSLLLPLSLTPSSLSP